MNRLAAIPARLITIGVAAAAMSASLLVVPVSALDPISVDRAELDDDEGLRVEGEDAVPHAIVWVTSTESSASSRADEDGEFRVLALVFRSSNCRATVTDGVTSTQVTLDECTPTAPPTSPPPTTAPSTSTTSTTTGPPPTTTTTTTATSTTVAPTTVPPTTTTTTTTTTATTTTTTPTTSTTSTTSLPPTTLPPTTTTTTTVPPWPGAFTDFADLVPQRCFSAPLSTVEGASVRVGIESGYSSTTWQNKACVAATTAFNPRSVSDTFTFTVTAPPGQHITIVRYQQLGSRFLQRSAYWRASGTGELTANGVSLPFSFTSPNLFQSIDLTGQNVESTTISVSTSLSAGRSANHPRVTDPPGSAVISVTSAVIIVESA